VVDLRRLAVLVAAGALVVGCGDTDQVGGDPDEPGSLAPVGEPVAAAAEGRVAS
jgi:hypothetical protein